MGMLLTLFGTPFFVSLGFAGLVHVLHKHTRCVQLASVSACRMLRAASISSTGRRSRASGHARARLHWTVGWGLLVLGIIANIIYISLEARPLTRVQ